MNKARLTKAQRERMRVFFLRPVESYDLIEAGCLCGMPVRELRRELEAGNHDATKAGDSWRLSWRQVAFLMFDRWTLAEIHESLGLDAVAVLPPLLTLRTISVRLPEYVVRALETAAADAGRTLDDALYGELIDFAGLMSDRLGRRVPGYREAYFYPGQE